jgi:hypothetical protein
MEENVNDFTQSPIPEFGTSMQPVVQGVLSGLSTIGAGVANAAQKEDQRKKELSKRLETSPDVYDLEQSYIDLAVEDLNKSIKSRIGDNTFDMTKSLDEDLEFRQKSQSIQNSAKISQANQAYYEKKKADYLENPEKWVTADFDAWEQEYTDPTLTIEERQKLRIGKDPLTEKEDVYDLVQRPIFPGFSEERDEKGDYVKYVDEENHAASIDRYIQSGKGAKLYDQYKEGNETKADFAKRMAADFQDNYFPDIKKHHIPSSRRTGSGRTDSTVWKAYTAREDQYGGDATKSNVIGFDIGRKKITLKDDKGSQYTPISMFMYYDANANQYKIKAKVKDEENFESEMIFSVSPNVGEDGNQNYEAITAAIKEPLKNYYFKPLKSAAPKGKSSSKTAGGFPKDAPND